jgi:ketosteroid isomerase-like protein
MSPRQARSAAEFAGSRRRVSLTTEQRASESAIRVLIERWATAVQAKDLDGVLADHAEDIQMFDVPPIDLKGSSPWPS